MQCDLNMVFQRYPRLVNLRGKVPDDVLRRELWPKVVEYERLLPRAERLIPSSRLCDVFPESLEHGENALRDFLGFWGNISVEELCKLCLVVQGLKPKRIFEFGTYNGLTTRQMAINAPADCRIVTLDIDPANASALDIGEIDQHLSQKVGAFDFAVGHRFHGTPEAEKITQIWGDSTAVDLSPYFGRMDVVLVDAGHTYHYVRSDTENARKLIRPGGLIVWHDCMQVLHPDVTRCLCEYAEAGMAIHHLRNTNLAMSCQDAPGAPAG